MRRTRPMIGRNRNHGCQTELNTDWLIASNGASNEEPKQSGDRETTFGGQDQLRLPRVSTDCDKPRGGFAERQGEPLSRFAGRLAIVEIGIEGRIVVHFELTVRSMPFGSSCDLGKQLDERLR